MTVRRCALGFPAAIAIALMTLSPIRVSGNADSAADYAATERLAGELTSDAQRLGALGTYWDPEASELVVVFPSDLPTIPSLVAMERRIDLRIVVAAAGSDDLQHAKDYVLALAGEERLTGTSTEVSLNLRSGRVEITSSADQKLFSAAFTTLGARGVFHARGGEFVRLSREDDFPPYWGGAHIRRAPAFHCTSGFAVVKNGVAYQTTAGHCFQFVGLVVADNGGDAYGTVVFKAPFPARDLLFLGGQEYGAYIYNGTSANPSAFARVTGAQNPVVGFNYCSSGMISLEKCGLTADEVDIQACEGNKCTDRLVAFNGQEPHTTGDSGAPVYIKMGTNPPTVGARAILVGEWDGNTYAQIWGAIQSAWGGGWAICTAAAGAC